MKAFALVAISALVLTGCSTITPEPQIRVEYRDRLVEVPRACPVSRPERPSNLRRPLPGTAAQMVDLLTAKLLEWAGPGGYGERADAAIRFCTE